VLLLVRCAIRGHEERSLQVPLLVVAAALGEERRPTPLSVSIAIVAI
jgi:hypothetical protein